MLITAVEENIIVLYSLFRLPNKQNVITNAISTKANIRVFSFKIFSGNETDFA